MSRSGFAYICWDSQGVEWACTDLALLEAVLAKLTQMDPELQVEKGPEHAFVPPYRVHICKLDKRGKVKDDRGYQQVAWWIMKQLCYWVWEPFEASGVFETTHGSSIPSDRGHFYLRLASQVG